MRIEELPALAGYRQENLDSHPGAVYALDAQLRLVFVNEGWRRFAAENGGEPAIGERWPLGRSILDALPGRLLAFYRDAYLRCLERGEPWEHDYECSSADRHRLFHQTVRPLSGGDGLLVVNALRVEEPHAAPGAEPAADGIPYADRHGIVHQCCHCRRIRAHDDPDRWDWVPRWVAAPPARTSHGLCKVCLDHYYPGVV